MGYREVRRMEIGEVLRRWQRGESRRAIARATGLSRNTVSKYLVAAAAAGLTRDGPPPAEELLAQLVQGQRPGPPAGRGARQRAQLEPHREQIAEWLATERLQVTRIQELLAQRGVSVPYTSLRRFIAAVGLRPSVRTTVRLAEPAPGEIAELDFGRLGPLVASETGKRQIAWGLVIVLAYSRHSFVWPLIQQTLAEVVAGLEAAWRFFGGIPNRLILDNFPAAVAGPDPLTPRLTSGFLEYSQARGFLVDPARVRRPQDKPHVERSIPYVRERFWKGGTFRDLADARRQAEQWCREVAGQRVHGTTRQLPLVVFRDHEVAHLRPYDGVPYDTPLWRAVTVHRDHHIQFEQALYSVPAASCPPGSKLEVRGDRALVRLYHRGELVKVHPRQPKGGRSTAPEDYPAERATYALRAPDRMIAQARDLGPHIGQFTERLLTGPLVWAKLRQGHKLLRLADRYTAVRLEAACARALGFDLIDVRRVERILVLALDREGLPAPPVEERLRPCPPSRFARPGSAFAHRTAPRLTSTPVPEDF